MFTAHERALLDEAVRQGQRTWGLIEPRRVVMLLPGTSPASSNSEDDVVRRLRMRGLAVEKPSVVVPSLLRGATTTWRCNPDAVVAGRVAIEVDSPEHLGGGPTHRTTGFPAHDLYRDDCLRSAGLVGVVRIRLAGLPPVPGAFNIMRERGVNTEVIEEADKACQAALAGSAPYDVVCSKKSYTRVTDGIAEGGIADDGTFIWRNTHDRMIPMQFRSGGRFLYAPLSEVAFAAENPPIPTVNRMPSWVCLAQVDFDAVEVSSWEARLRALKPSSTMLYRRVGQPPFSEFPFDGPVLGSPCTIERGDVTREIVVNLRSEQFHPRLRAHLDHRDALVVFSDETNGRSLFSVEVNPQMLAMGYVPRASESGINIANGVRLNFALPLRH